jgi:hypothetical protein
MIHELFKSFGDFFGGEFSSLNIGESGSIDVAPTLKSNLF